MYKSFTDDEDRYLHGRVRRKKNKTLFVQSITGSTGLVIWRNGKISPTCYKHCFKMTILLGNEEWVDKNIWWNPQPLEGKQLLISVGCRLDSSALNFSHFYKYYFFYSSGRFFMQPTPMSSGESKSNGMAGVFSACLVKGSCQHAGNPCDKQGTETSKNRAEPTPNDLLS